LDASGQRQPRNVPKRLKLTAFVLGCSLIALIVATVLLAQQAQLVREAMLRQTALNGWEGRLQHVLLRLTDAETGQRGYLLTGADQYLLPYRQALEELPKLQEKLEAIPLSDPTVSRRLRDIRQKVALKVAELAETIRLHDEGQNEAALALVRSDAGRLYMEEIRADIDTVAATLRANRNDTNARVVSGSMATERLAIATVTALIVTVILAALQIGALRAGHARYEEALRASERRHRAIVEEQTEFIAISDLQGSLSYVNPAYARFFGVPATDLSGRNLYDGMLPADADEAREKIETVLRTGEPTSIESRVSMTGESPHWIAWCHRVQHTPGGDVVIHSVGRDITLRKELESRVERSERFIRTLTDSIPVRLSYFDTQRRFKFVNRVLCDRFGKPREAFIGHDLHEVSDGPHIAALAGALESALAGELQRIEYLDSSAGRAARHIETQLIPDRGADGEIRGAFAIGVDITHLKRVEGALRELTEVFDNTPDYIAQADDRGWVHYINPAARRALGLDASASCEGRRFTEFFTAETNQRWAGEIIPAVRQDGVWVGETAVVLQGGRGVPVSHMVIAHRDPEGRLTRYSSILRDISVEVAARRELSRQTAALNAIVDSIPVMVGVCDTDFRYQLINRAYERWRGRNRREFIGHTLQEMLEPQEFERSLPWAQRALAGETVSYEIENVFGVDARHLCIMYIPLRLEDGTIGGFVAMVEDITQHREENLRLLLLSERDPLTGLLNKMGFESYLSKRMMHGEGRYLAVIYIDLDRFKPINDTYGHATGDEVLRHFATRLHSVVRPSDAVARLGGDEFAVVLTGVRGLESAALVAEKIVQLTRQPMAIDGHQLEIGASVGVAFDADAAGGWGELVAAADAMAYRAKADGRGRYALPHQSFKAG
jgi:diguanylate cyclase (GGDEF)-like protein/PAS domain S-box-containing protein